MSALDVRVGVLRVLCAEAALAELPRLPGAVANVIHLMRPGDLLLLGPSFFDVAVRGEERAELAEAIAPPGAVVITAGVAPRASRCQMVCPHGDRCRLTAGHELEGFGCSHLPPPVGCDCNEPNRPLVLREPPMPCWHAISATYATGMATCPRCGHWCSPNDLPPEKAP